MVISSAKDFSPNHNQLIDLDHLKNNKNRFKTIRQNGQIQIYQSSYRGSFCNIIRDSLRNAALGRRVLLVQFMKGGVKQGISNATKMCDNLLWIRSPISFDQFDESTINKDASLSLSIREAVAELWNFSKKQILAGEQDQIILDEVFRAIDLNIIDEDDLISTLQNRFVSGDVILTGTAITKKLLIMADQVTELRS